MLNKFTIQGRMAFDPKLQTSHDVSYSNFRIAWTSSFKDGAGNKKTEFFSITAFKKTAEFISKYFKKGDMILVEGTIREKDKKIEMIADEVFFCGSKSESKVDSAKQTMIGENNSDDDLPF